MSRRVKVLVTVFFMGVGYSIVYALPFIQYMFYEPMREALGATNAQLGTLIALFGLGNIFGAPIGGWVADKFNHKNVYLLALAGNAALSFFFAFNLSYRIALFVWLGLAITGLFGVFPAHNKIIRLLGKEDGQGSIFGLTEGAAGVAGIIVNAVAVFVFARGANELLGFRSVIIGYGIFGVLVAIVLYFLIDNPKNMEISTSEEDKIKISDFLVVLKNRGTWHAGFSIFAIYTLYVSLSYFTPYSQNMLGVTAAAAGTIAVIRTYVIRVVGSPLGGYFGDRIGSVSKVIIMAAIGGILSILTIMLLPPSTNMYIVLGVILLVSVFTYMGRGTMFAVQAEVKIPIKYAATAAGITCAIGYAPDLFQFTLFGNWLDNYGDAGYNYIFIYTIIVLALGVVNSILAIKYKNSLKEDSKIKYDDRLAVDPDIK